jgi:hypothetical protein
MSSPFLDDDNQGTYCIIEEHEIEILDGFEMLDDSGGSEKHDERENREKCVNSDDKEMKNEMKNENIKLGVNTNVREVELSINTSTCDEVIFKKHKVEIIHKHTGCRIMDGVVCGYTLIGRVYDPDIIITFDDGRSFYNENFEYLMRFYI